MKKGIFAVLAVLAAVCFYGRPALCAGEELTKDKILGIAIEHVKAQGISVDGVTVIYDEDGKLWSEKTGMAKIESESPNHGVLVKGFLKNYRIVYFDFQDPLPDLWVIVDKDTGEVLGIVK